MTNQELEDHLETFAKSYNDSLEALVALKTSNPEVAELARQNSLIAGMITHLTRAIVER